MPHSSSAKKRVKQNERSRLINKAKRSAMRTQLKKVREAIDSGDRAAATKELVLAMKRIDKAAKARVIHPNKAAREKSNLQRDINRIAAG